MDFEKIAEEAYKRNGINEMWDLPARYAYLQLETLYYNYKIGEISKEDSIIEKSKIKKEYEYFKRDYEDTLNVYKEYNENRKKTNVSLTEIEKSTDKDEILSKALEIIAKFISDKDFKDRILRKFS